MLEYKNVYFNLFKDIAISPQNVLVEQLKGLNKAASLKKSRIF